MPREKLPGTPIFTRVQPATKEAIEALAARYRVTPADLLRWLAEDAATGRYVPSHFAALVADAEKKKVPEKKR